MNRERLKELMPVMQAFLNGKQIQYRPAGLMSGTWMDCHGDPRWISTSEYRVKPDPHPLEGVEPGEPIWVRQSMAHRWQMQVFHAIVPDGVLCRNSEMWESPDLWPHFKPFIRGVKP